MENEGSLTKDEGKFIFEMEIMKVLEPEVPAVLRVTDSSHAQVNSMQFSNCMDSERLLPIFLTWSCCP